jgi:hypothetical protein
MTSKQEKYYWRLWGRVVAANDWRLVKGRWQVDVARNRAHSPLHARVWDAAAARAAQEHRAPTADDLRHGCHAVAAGRDKGHAEFTNAEFDRFVSLAALLIDRDDIDASMQFAAPEIGERRRLVARIQSVAPEAYVCEICRHRSDWDYHDPFWEDMPIAQLRQLLLTVKERTRAWTRPVPAAVAVGGQRVTTDLEEPNPFNVEEVA